MNLGKAFRWLFYGTVAVIAAIAIGSVAGAVIQLLLSFLLSPFGLVLGIVGLMLLGAAKSNADRNKTQTMQPYTPNRDDSSYDDYSGIGGDVNAPSWYSNGESGGYDGGGGYGGDGDGGE